MSLDLNRIIKAIHNTDLILTPKVNDWLVKCGDDALPPDVVKVIARLLGTQPRVRSSSFSASSAGACHRAQVLGYLGAPEGVIDPQLRNIFNDGKWRHLRWQAMLLSAGLLTDIEDPLVWKKMRAVGTMDGSGVVGDDHPKHHWRGLDFGFELKGVSGYQFGRLSKEGPMLKHRKQVARYFLMSGFDLFVIVYEDKTTQEWKEWVIEPDDELVEEQRKELKALNKWVDAERLPPLLPECMKRQGAFNDCNYGGKFGPCVKTKNWPRKGHL